MQNKLLNEVSENIQNVDVALLLQKTDRILAGNEKIVVQDATKFSTRAIAFSDTSKLLIFLNFNGVTNIKSIKNIFDYLILIKGLNYHELAHILYTDYTLNRIRTFLEKKYIANKGKLVTSSSEFLETLNVLEDGRIENLFYTQYKRAKYYFSFCVSNLLLSKQDLSKFTISDLTTAYILLYGRKFLSVKYAEYIVDLRKKVALKISKEKLNKIEQLVDSYSFELDLNARLEIAYKLILLLKNYNVKIISTSSSKSIERGKSIKGTKKRTKDAVEKLRELEKENKKDNQQNQKTNQTNKIEIHNADLKDVFEKIKEDIENIATIQTEVENEKARLSAGNSEFEAFSGDIHKITSKSKVEIKKIENVLRKLRGDLSTQIFRFQRKGKIDVISIIKSQRNSSLKIFRNERINKIDKCKLGVSLLLDSSGSISSSDFRNEINASFCLTKALEKLANKIEILEFSSYFRVLKKFNSEGDWHRSYDGGTNIASPLKQSIVDLKLLRRKEDIQNLFIIIVSDGQFNESVAETSRVFDEARKQGIKVLWILASNYPYHRYRDKQQELSRKVDWFIQIKDLSELSIKLKNIIKELQQEIIKKIKLQNGFYH